MRKRGHFGRMWAAVMLAGAFAFGARADSGPVYGLRLEGFAYPWPVREFGFTSQRQTLRMAYLDVRPAQANGQVAVLLHGKNFCAGTWEETIRVLVARGYRVIAPDQIGFCKSDTPDNYQFSFEQLALNTRDLLDSLGIGKAVMIGHSTGGMLAVRYALMFPDRVTQLVMVDPLGLEDWRAKGAPYQSVDQWFVAERHKTADAIRAYEKKVYYAGEWKPAYETWVQMLAGQYRGSGAEALAWNSARLYDMIYTQPVVYEFPALRVPTVLMIGDRDITAIGADRASPEVRARLGHYPALGKEAVAAIPGAKLIEFPTLGHAPQIQDPAAFHSALLRSLR
ncbi:alpha/beta fold hydrolase [Acetobacter fallax]|uniref:Alpha/beta fold hydrolase n=1 Tax=Acetobacter fallax TaxID=1737473 RepID=A0ABX0KED9_9PROT|nr:alpha/beta hydrolase [Acetobacter fallax]NHO33854.1 alpha/beta fold hydrolase [Acetobacter fallax]NHO37414.1 alpha/beta fold hydrolase [Acetobacter fallax]